MTVHVTSEIGSLRSVIVHTPGDELLGITPATREAYLYDDLPDAEQASREHHRFTAVLERFCRVHQVRDLLAHVLENRETRELLIGETMDIVPSEPLAREIEALPPAELVTMLIEGRVESPGPLARSLNQLGYELPPLPNLFFTRDSAMGVGRHMLIGSMRFGIRWPEELIMKAVFSFHPLLRNEGIIFDGSTERRLNYTLEGGDVHPLREDLVVVGFSERSSPEKTDIFTALADCGMPMTPIFAGGDSRVIQEREQWASGCNFVAMRPGLVLSYARNGGTLREMERAGFAVVTAEDFLADEAPLRDDARAVITFPGSELVRGGGGPRCMTLPVQRDDPWT